MPVPVIAGDDVPYLTTRQMVEVDRAMIEDFGITLIQMMENAGRSLAHVAREVFLDGDPQGKSVLVLAGSGGNGGGALVCARRLHGYGARVEVVITRRVEDLAGAPAHQLVILQKMQVPTVSAADLPKCRPDLIIDGLIGYSLRGSPRGAAGELIRWANQRAAPVLSLDVPSGIDADTGVVHDPVIDATATMTLALPKKGLRAPGAIGNVGTLYLADIGVPPALYASPPLRLQVGSLFAESDIVRIQRH